MSIELIKSNTKCSEQLIRLYSLVLKEGFNIHNVRVSDYETKSSGMLQKTTVVLDGYHAHDPHDYTSYELSWLSDGTGANFDLFFAMECMYHQVMKHTMEPARILMNKDTFEAVRTFGVESGNKRNI